MEGGIKVMSVFYDANVEPNVWITLETDQKCIKPTIKINEKATAIEVERTIQTITTSLDQIKTQLESQGFAVAPLPIKVDVKIKK
jgi:hypothetical protein